MKYAAELIGTFFLVLTIGMVALEPGAGNFAGIAIGAVLLALVYAGRHISGAHYNPTITLSLVVRGRCTPAEILPYWIAQLIGAVLAAFATMYLKGGGAAAPMTIATVPALVAEFLFTFALAWVILNVATSKNTEGNSYFGIAIGLVVTAGVYAVGDISAAAFNPAVAIALATMGIVEASTLWIYMAACFSAAALAGIVFKVVNPDDA